MRNNLRISFDIMISNWQWIKQLLNCLEIKNIILITLSNLILEISKYSVVSMNFILTKKTYESHTLAWKYSWKCKGNYTRSKSAYNALIFSFFIKGLRLLNIWHSPFTWRIFIRSLQRHCTKWILAKISSSF